MSKDFNQETTNDFLGDPLPAVQQKDTTEVINNITNGGNNGGSSSVAGASPSSGKKAYLKTINITIEDDIEDDDNSEMIWFDLDDFECGKSDPSFATAQLTEFDSGSDKANGNDSIYRDAQYWPLINHFSNLASVDSAISAATSSQQLSGLLGTGSRNELINFLRQQKRIIWGEEVPCSATSWSLDTPNTNNYIMTMGINPLITIRPVGRNDTNKDDILITSSASTSVVQSNRLLDLDQLRNYFMLTEPSPSESGSQVKFNVKYYLSLLDPSMPRLTNCGHYYRMRYAVYVTLKKGVQINRSMSNSNWRNQNFTVVSEEDDDAHSSSKNNHQLIHIGEMHLYTIFPKDNSKIDSSKMDLFQPRINSCDYIHYENISFFLNQTPLTAEELAMLQLAENDLNQLAVSFRRFLKHLNSIIVTVNSTSSMSSQTNFNSTFLLEQLKYPKSSDNFTNPDRFCEQFLRNQSEMFSRYYGYYCGKTTSASGSGFGVSDGVSMLGHTPPLAMPPREPSSDPGSLAASILSLKSPIINLSALSSIVSPSSSLLSASSGGLNSSKPPPPIDSCKEMLCADSFVANLYRLAAEVSDYHEKEPKSIMCRN